MHTKTVLVTRPLTENTPLNDALQERGYHVIHEPLTEIFLEHNMHGPLENILGHDPDAVILTSQHGANALATLTPLRDMPLICVGEATEHTAQLHGFMRCYNAGGDSEKLVDYIADAYDPESFFLYVSARDISTDLVAELAALNMQVERIPAYTAEATEQFSDTLAEQIRREQIDMVTFMSARAATIFSAHVHKAKLEDCMSHMTAYCLSPSIAEHLEALPFKKIYAAHAPTVHALLDCMDTQNNKTSTG